MERDQAQMTRNDRWWEGTGGMSPMADFVCATTGPESADLKAREVQGMVVT